MVAGTSTDPAPVAALPLVEVDDVSVAFRIGRGVRRSRLVAVAGVTFEIAAGETFGLVGESGSGKSTVGRAIVGLLTPDAGAIRILGSDVSTRRSREVQRQVQMVFQDPYSSLNPSMVVSEIVGEPLRVHTSMSRSARSERVAELLDQVGMSRHHLERYPSEFSGGQRQRIAIARAIALDPEFVVCDEAVSALDVSTQSQVVNLLEELQRRNGLAYLFIAHDLAVVRHISHRIGVMYLGHLMETGPAERVYSAPRHPYTRALLDAIPVPDPRRQRERRAQRAARPAEVLSFHRPASGCAFRLRCPHAMDICSERRPDTVEVPDGGTVACHLVP